MTRDEMINTLKQYPHLPITHYLFADDEYIFSNMYGIVYDESGRIFENWDSVTDVWSGINGLRLRTGGMWEDGWRIKTEMLESEEPTNDGTVNA